MHFNIALGATAALLLLSLSVSALDSSPNWGTNDETKRKWQKFSDDAYADTKSLRRDGDSVFIDTKTLIQGQWNLGKMAINCRSKEFSLYSSEFSRWLKPFMINDGSFVAWIYEGSCKK